MVRCSLQLRSPLTGFLCPGPLASPTPSTADAAVAVRLSPAPSPLPPPPLGAPGGPQADFAGPGALLFTGLILTACPRWPAPCAASGAVHFP